MDNNIAICDIFIDKNGTWYYRGAEMKRREIVNYFYDNLKRDANGRYMIELPEEEGDRCYVDVEDTAFVVRSVHGRSPNPENGTGISLCLSDDSEEKLDPSTLRVGQDNVLYCSVKKGRFSARFSRASYYQLAENIEYDDVKDGYFLRLSGRRFYIQGGSNR
jgi:uncharacterized protein